MIPPNSKPYIHVTKEIILGYDTVNTPIGFISNFCIDIYTHIRSIVVNHGSINYCSFQVSLPTPPTLSHKLSFIPRTCNLWNVLPSPCFPESDNLPSFTSKIDKLGLIYLSSKPFALFSLPLLGLCIGHYGLSSI